MKNKAMMLAAMAAAMAQPQVEEYQIHAQQTFTYDPIITSKINNGIGKLSRHKAKMKCKKYCASGRKRKY